MDMENLHATISSSIAAWLLYKSFPLENPITQQISGMESLGKMELLFLGLDSFRVLATRRMDVKTRSILWHHLFFAIPLRWYLKMNPRKYDFFVGASLLMNATTPLLNLSKRMSKTNGHNHSVDLINNTLLISFFILRLLMPFLLYFYYSRQQKLPWYCTLGTTVILSMNSIWLIALRNQIRQIQQLNQ